MDENFLKNLPPMNEHKKVLIEQVIRGQENYDQLLLSRAKDDLYIFNKYVLGVGDGEKNVELAPFHKRLCHVVTDDIHKKKLILVPRGHLKSTLITIGYSVFRIINNPNVRILILNATWQMAVDFLSQIKKHLTSNQELIRLFGEFASESDREEWSQDRITLKRTDPGIKGPTVWATGIESNLVGSHPDVIIFDDVVNRDNTNTPEQIEKVILRYKDALDLLEPGGQLIVVGTRWTELDLYGWILDKENKIIQSYETFIEKAYEGDLETGEGFQSLWKEKFSQKELLSRLREKGWYEFSAQYNNDPLPPQDATFKKEYFQYFDYEEIRGKEMTKIITIDPAISLEKDADFTAMVVSGLDTFGNIFVLDIVRERLTPSQIINKIFVLNELWHPQHVGVETVAYQKALAYSLREEMTKRNRYLPITELKPEERSKDQRIKGLQPVYENKKVFHRNKMELKNMIYLENELLAFPRGSKDDVVDALSYSLDLLHPPRKKVTRYQHEYLY